MADEVVDPQQSPPDDVGRQPGVPTAMAPQLRLTQTGNGVAVLAVVFGVAALWTYPNTGTGSTGRVWAVSALGASLAMLVICTLQHLLWLRAVSVWRGERSGDLRPLTRLSWVLHLVSYAVVLFGLWAGITGSVAAGTTETAAVLLAFTLLFLVAAQVLAAVQYVRTEGPPGTIPSHLRRLAAAIESRR